jgi:tetratricopeptide (TPR) repeat protein
MSTYLPFIYLSALVGILSVLGWLILREVNRNREQENVITRLQSKLSRTSGTAEEHYELGKVYLEKRLYQQAIVHLKKALEVAQGDLPVVCNALGFAYFSQGQYDLATRYYKDAVKADPNYVTAWNNLGHTYEKKNLVIPSLEAYETALRLDPKNDIAKRRAESMRKRIPDKIVGEPK